VRKGKALRAFSFCDQSASICRRVFSFPQRRDGAKGMAFLGERLRVIDKLFFALSAWLSLCVLCVEKEKFISRRVLNVFSQNNTQELRQV
jgi:hypothetical protein